MATLYIRDVAPTVAETLKERAAAEGQSLSAYVNAQLTRLASTPTNAEIVERLRNVDRTGGASREQIIDELRSSRR